MQFMCLKVRRILIMSERLTRKIRYRLLEIIELSLNRWDVDNLQTDVSKMYEHLRDRFGDHYLSIAPAAVAGTYVIINCALIN